MCPGEKILQRRHAGKDSRRLKGAQQAKRGNLAGRADDSRADGVADGYGYAKANTQRSDEPAAPFRVRIHWNGFCRQGKLAAARRRNPS